MLFLHNFAWQVIDIRSTIYKAYARDIVERTSAMILQKSNVFKNFFNLTLATLVKNKSAHGSIRLLSSISEDKSETDNKDKKSSIFKEIIYGNPQIKEEESQTHSKLIARGKYVHEIQSIYLSSN